MPSPQLSPFQIFYRSRLWALIWGYILVIYLTLPVMRLVLNALKDSVGRENIGIGLNALLFLAAMTLLFVALRHGWITVLALALPLAIMGVVALQLHIPEERVHFLQYGLLGILAVKTVRVRSGTQLILISLFVILVGCGDEAIQWLLPNRVGDWRDVGMNTLASTLGVVMGAALFWREAPREMPQAPNSTNV